MKRYMKINAADNVCVILADGVKAGEQIEIDGVRVILKEDVAR